MKHSLLLAFAFAFGCVSISSAETLFKLEMDQQVNNGAGDAIYAMPTNPSGFPIEIGTQGDFTRCQIRQGGGWWYGPFVSFRRAIGHDLDISDPKTIMTFFGRVYNDATNTNPYDDANIFVRLYSADENEGWLGWRDYSLVYGPKMKDNPDKYPGWLMPKLFLNDFAAHKAEIGNTDPNYTAYGEGQNGTGVFDVTKVAYMRFYGTDWTGKGADYVDVRDLHVQTVPEPASLIALGVGALALLRKRSK